MSDQEITEFRVYPSIGIARVGNSPDEYFFGPEAPGPHPHDPGNFRDSQGRVKRQAARFRVYGFNRAGEVVKEMTNDGDTEIAWRVQVANKKSSWFNFDLAMDIPESVDVNSTRRNASIGDRASLEITPDAVTIRGNNTNAGGTDSDYAFDDGKFHGHKVYLGEVRTDDDGRLIFLGGRGHSANPWGYLAHTFGNNDGFHDDVSDGPVDAHVRYKGRDYSVTGSWVVVGPPNFAPGIQGVVTGWDLLYDLYRREGTLPDHLKVETPRFSQEIWPLLRRFPNHQWVNAGFARDFGRGGTNDWRRSRRRLADPSERSAAVRNAVFELFRPADYSQPWSNALPGYYGDAVTMDISEPTPARCWMGITETQYRWLEQWAAGDFIVDRDPAAFDRDADGFDALDAGDTLVSFDDLSPAEQVSVIDRAVLDETLGGPFHPGAEFTWPMRVGKMYGEPFRIKRRDSEPDFGPLLTSTNALMDGGPLDGSVPGSITRWMAIPWQTDSSSCLSAYVPYVDDYLPTFWPARVPNDVLTEEQFEAWRAGGHGSSGEVDALSYLKRPKWLRGIRYPKGIAFPQEVNKKRVGCNRFIHKWPEVGIVTQVWHHDRPKNIWVETGRTLDHDESEESTPIQQEDPRARD